MTLAQSAPPPKPWYYEPWPWILMAGPFVAMIGCFITIYFAYSNFTHEPILEGVVKRGLVIEQAAPKTGEAAGAARANP
ncbi:nitrogen fixation protein FixH [Achromobacter marplatensis]|uniref:FixH family protein n=1 Tax=Achromobacter marplatensis TaxID=470868 RepID=A0ABX9GA49_9BURK|nr:FixH family protein [Achromobacter marplatensis]OWT67491.1 nitrogen fixation protein FixH [Achromobacter marplatensis]RBP20066.1 hypothetical protein DFP87_104406 [Achromobacter marplatensis]CAB3634835.1 hypothetical protein LMG26219_01483 [Achromobacter marplatensis]